MPWVAVQYLGMPPVFPLTPRTSSFRSIEFVVPLSFLAFGVVALVRCTICRRCDERLFGPYATFDCDLSLQLLNVELAIVRGTDLALAANTALQRMD